MRRIALLVLVAFVVLYHVYDNYLSKEMLVGTYDNINYEKADFNYPDTLKLLKDSTVLSTNLGLGKYEISHSLRGTELVFNFKGFRWETLAGRNLLGKPVVFVGPKPYQHYIKISEEASFTDSEAIQANYNSGRRMVERAMKSIRSRKSD